VAKTDPDKALEMIKGLSDDSKREQEIAVAVAFFPRDQLDRAVEAARGIKNTLNRALALTRLASLAPRERVPALIEEAADTLVAEGRKTVEEPAYFGDTRQVEALARVACVARRLGYSQYQEMALRAASLCSRGAGNFSDAGMNVRNEFQIARVLAFTSPELARDVINSALAGAGGMERLNPQAYDRLAAAAAEVDPQWAAELVKQMKPDAADADRAGRASAVGSLVARLLDSPEDRETRMLTEEDYQYSWLPVDKDD